MASPRRLSNGVVRLPRPEQTSQPRLAPGCRWGTQGEQQVVLFPEGMIRVQGTGQSILELCDGQRTLQEIVTTLSERYGAADPVKITEDVSSFLEALQRKRIVDY
ncbi:MAG: pyrroloquinoline quinone biosynthesis peptide chaperone PqqD [Candidatus Korobacteraceae bacterium]|jgi:pyrroloquinoline quinone biosynthesis protein D